MGWYRDLLTAYSGLQYAVYGYCKVGNTYTFLTLHKELGDNVVYILP